MKPYSLTSKINFNSQIVLYLVDENHMNLSLFLNSLFFSYLNIKNEDNKDLFLKA